MMWFKKKEDKPQLRYEDLSDKSEADAVELLEKVVCEAAFSFHPLGGEDGG